MSIERPRVDQVPPNTFSGTPARAHINMFLCDYFRPGRGAKRVLDVGCGRGDNLFFLLGRELECYAGLDIESRPEWQGWSHKDSRCRFYQMDALCVAGLGKGSFDLALAITSFEHLQDDVRALRAAAETLASGGEVLIVVPNRLSRLVYSVHGYRRYDKRTLERLAARAGMKTLRYQSLGGLPSFLFHFLWFWTPVLLLRLCRIIAFGGLSPEGYGFFRGLREKLLEKPLYRRFHVALNQILTRLDPYLPLCKTIDVIQLTKP